MVISGGRTVAYPPIDITISIQSKTEYQVFVNRMDKLIETTGRGDRCTDEWLYDFACALKREAELCSGQE